MGIATYVLAYPYCVYRPPATHTHTLTSTEVKVLAFETDCIEQDIEEKSYLGVYSVQMAALELRDNCG